MKKDSALLLLLSAVSFIVFFQTYLFAPILGSLAHEFNSTTSAVGWLVPAFMLPYGISALFTGPLSDRFGRLRVILILVAFMCFAIAGAASAKTLFGLIAWRVAAGVSTGGVIPTAIALLGDLIAYEKRGKSLGWIFSGMAGGAAFGSTLGAYLNPIIGWRAELVAVAVVTFAILVCLKQFEVPASLETQAQTSLAGTFKTYWQLFTLKRGFRAYSFIFANSAFHSGVFTWLGVYFARRYQLDDQGVGLALLGYGIPGMLFGPVIGHSVDRLGRNKLIPIGLAVSALSAFLLVPSAPLFVSALVIACLSLGYDLTQPLFAGLVTSLDASKRGQAIALSAFCLFLGFGLGPLFFQSMLSESLSMSLLVFATVEIVLMIASTWVFRHESVEHARTLR